MVNTVYSKLADVYDQIYHFKNYDAESRYISDLIKMRHPSARTVLETACGTGRFLEFLSRTFSVEGLDLSPEMLEYARARTRGVPLHEGDMSSFDLGRNFDVVCCLFRSIAHCRTPQRLNQAIQCMARHLKPGGLLLIEPFFTPHTFWDKHLVLNEYKGDDMKIAWMYVGERNENQVLLNMHFLVGTAQGVSHFTEAINLGLFTRDQFYVAFAEAGLRAEYDEVGPSGVGLYVGSKPE